jgi:hypothetical protein
MRTFKPLVLLTLLVAQSASTQAADLNGAWTIDASACGKVFTKENNQLAFKQDADLYAGRLIVRGKQITGTFLKSALSNRCMMTDRLASILSTGIAVVALIGSLRRGQMIFA